MSEYQYYEFQAIDQPLSTEEQQIVSQLSSRVQLSSTEAVFNYSYGDFPGKPKQVLSEYFDALFYDAFSLQIQRIYQQYSRLPGLLRRLRKAGLYP